MMNIFYVVLKIVRKTLLLPLTFLDFLVPKDLALFVFSNRGGKEAWQGNNAFLYAYLSRVHPEYKIVVLSDKDMDIVNSIRLHSFSGLWYLLRSGVAFFHHGPLDYDIPLLCKNRLNVNLSHAIHFKRVAYTLKNYKPMFFETKNVIPYHFCSSDTDVLAACSYYRIDFENARVTGAPKNDVFFMADNILPKGYSEEKAQLKEAIGNKKIVMYAPTWREEGESYVFSSDEIDELERSLLKNDAIMLFAIHPLLKGYSIPESSCFFDANAYVSDIQIALSITDVLITDYSTIWIDFLLKNKPIIGFWYDIDKYMASRGFIFDVKDKFPDSKCSNFHDLINLLNRSLSCEWTLTEKQLFLKNYFHQYTDGCNSNRVIREVEKLL